MFVPIDFWGFNYRLARAHEALGESRAELRRQLELAIATRGEEATKEQLTAITQQVKPEQFTNYELGAKWDVRQRLSLNTAIYRLDRTNTRSK